MMYTDLNDPSDYMNSERWRHPVRAWFRRAIEKLTNPPTFVIEDQPTILTPAHYARKTAYRIDPLLAASLKVENPHNPRCEEERDGSELWKQRFVDRKGNRYWKPLLMLVLAATTTLAASTTVLISSTTAAPAKPDSRSSVVRYSDTGYHVRQIQYKLKSFGYSIVVDGEFYSQTKRIVQLYQKANGLTPNGIVDRKTLKALGVTLGAPITVGSNSKLATPTPDDTNGDPVWVPSGPLSVEDMIRVVWPDDLEQWALGIAYRESRYQARVHTWCCYGIFQIHQIHLQWLCEAGIACTIEDLYDPMTNIKAAYALYQRNGKGPWSL